MALKDSKPVLYLSSPSVDDIIVEIEGTTNLTANSWQPLLRWTATNHWQVADPSPSLLLDGFLQRCTDERPNQQCYYRVRVDKTP